MLLRGSGKRESGKIAGTWLAAGWSNARKTTQFLRLDGLELIGDSDLECTGSIMTYLEWPGENEPRPIT
jgi:hypothetical protein